MEQTIPTAHNCRNCGSDRLRELGFAGILAGFFLKRVFHAEIAVKRSRDGKKRKIQSLSEPLRKLLSRIHAPAVAVELQSCQNCSFIQTRFPFADDAISRLYVDYRSESYNRERCQYEPEYGGIQSAVGGHTENGLGRIEALTAWISSKIDWVPGSMLDFGGADGKYLPDLLGTKFVYEVSDVAPAPGVTRIADEASLQSYEYVQLSHVLEHVTHPLNLTMQVARLVKPGGYLLIEVPQDLHSDELQALQQGTSTAQLTVHEHINFYSAAAVEQLIKATGLERIAVDAVPVLSPMARQFFIRALARKSTP